MAAETETSTKAVVFAEEREESVDVSFFIASRLAEVDKETDGLTKDTMLHYGYEGENSDMEDLSELDVSDDEDEDINDFSYVKSYGYEFHKLYVILNPQQTTTITTTNTTTTYTYTTTTTDSDPDYEEVIE